MVATKVKSVRALERGLGVLEAIAERGTLTLSDLHTQTGLPRATLLGALKTLDERGWISVRRDGTAYGIGPKMAGAGQSRGGALPELAAPILDALCRKVIWPSDLAVCRDNSMFILQTSRRKSPFVINRKAVGRRPSLLKSATGRAYLAFCPDSERKRLLENLRRSTAPDDRRAAAASWVDRLLRQTRAQGYGVRDPGYWAGADDYGEEVNAIAVPVMIREQVIACINLLWVSGTSSVDAFAARYMPALTEAAAELARSYSRVHSLPDL